MRADLISAKRTTLVAAATLVALSLPSSSVASTGSSAAVPELPPPGKITLEVQEMGGNGCPGPASATVTPKADDTGFEIRYKQFAVRNGPGATANDIRKFCQAAILVHVPQGYTFAIARADYKGYLYLHSGATGTFNTQYYFQGESFTAESNAIYNGHRSGRWSTSDDSAALIYAKCGADIIVNAKTSLHVSKGTDKSKTNVMAMQTSDANVHTLFNFAWKRC